MCRVMKSCTVLLSPIGGMAHPCISQGAGNPGINVYRFLPYKYKKLKIIHGDCFSRLQPNRSKGNLRKEEGLHWLTGLEVHSLLSSGLVLWYLMRVICMLREDHRAGQEVHSRNMICLSR